MATRVLERSHMLHGSELKLDHFISTNPEAPQVLKMFLSLVAQRLACVASVFSRVIASPFLFFCSRRNVLDELARKRLLRRLLKGWLRKPRVVCVKFEFRYETVKSSLIFKETKRTAVTNIRKYKRISGKK